MDIGISTACFYPLATEESLKNLINLGFKTFEVFLNSISEFNENYLYTLKSIVDNKGCTIKSIHPFISGFEPCLLFSNYYRRFIDSLDIYKKIFDSTKKLGASIAVLHGDKNKLNKGISNSDYFERFSILSDFAKDYGVTLAQENVNCYRSQSIEFIREMSTYLKGKVKYVFDVKQAIRARQNPYEMCKVMGEDLIHVHINDFNLENDCLLPGKGILDLELIKGILKNNNYNGSLIIEVYSKSFSNDKEIVDSYKYIQKKLI